MVPAQVAAGASMGDPTAAWVNTTDGKMCKHARNLYHYLISRGDF